MKRAALLLGLSAVGACAHRADALVTLSSPVPSARIYVDDRLIGSAVAPHRIALDAGLHRVELRADGYYDAYRTLSVSPAPHPRPIALDTPLRPIPDGADPY